MFNLLAVRAAAIPRLSRLISDPSTPAAEKMQMEDQLEHEKNKTRRGDTENALRRHNLLPAVFAMLKAMGETGAISKSTVLECADDRRGCERRAGEGEGKERSSEEAGRGGVRDFKHIIAFMPSMQHCPS